MIASRRGFLTGIGAMLAAPAIVHAGNLMPVRGIVMDVPRLPTMPVSLLEQAAALQYEINGRRSACAYWMNRDRIYALLASGEIQELS